MQLCSICCALPSHFLFQPHHFTDQDEDSDKKGLVEEVLSSVKAARNTVFNFFGAGGSTDDDNNQDFTTNQGNTVTDSDRESAAVGDGTSPSRSSRAQGMPGPGGGCSSSPWCSVYL